MIGYLGEVLGMDKDGEVVGAVLENPISILTSVFILNMTSIKTNKEAPITSGPETTGGDDLTFDQLCSKSTSGSAATSKTFSQIRRRSLF